MTRTGTNPIDILQNHKASRPVRERLDRGQEYRELGYDADSGKSILEGQQDGAIIQSEPITNGYRAPGQPVSASRSGSTVQSNSMPHPRSARTTQSRTPTVKKIKFLWRRWVGGALKYFVGGHVSAPIDVTNNNFLPKVIENHGNNKFVLIGYASGALGFTDDILIQHWDGKRITRQVLIAGGGRISRDYTAGVSAGSICLIESSIVSTNTSISTSNVKKIYEVLNPKASSRFGVRSTFASALDASIAQSAKQFYYEDGLNFAPMVGSFSSIDTIISPTITKRDYSAITNTQGLILPGQVRAVNTSDVRENWSYSGTTAIGAPLQAATVSHDYTDLLISDWRLNSALAFESKYAYSGNSTVGASVSTATLASNLILISSSGGDVRVDANFDIKDFDFFPASPINNPISTGKQTTIAAVPRITNVYFEDSIHFLNFATLRDATLTIVDPIKDELNTWQIAARPIKTTKKADYYPLPKGAEILGAQWHP
jgi:hypothetical protein